MLDTIFSTCSALALFGWVLLIIFPRQRHARPVAGIGIPLSIAVVYAVLIALYLGRSEGGFATLAGVARLFENPALLLSNLARTLLARDRVLALGAMAMGVGLVADVRSGSSWRPWPG